MEAWWKKVGEGFDDTIDIPSSTYNVTCATVLETVPRLLQVEYPGFVENPANAVRTMGGIHKVSQILSTPKKKLEVRFRPGDVYCKPAYGVGHVTCGLLIKLRRRRSASVPGPKPADADPPILIELSHLPDTNSEDKDKDEQDTSSLLSNTPYRIIKTSTKQQVVVFDGPLPAEIRDNFEKLRQKQSKEPDPSNKERLAAAGIRVLEEEQKFLADLTVKKRFRNSMYDEGIFQKDVKTNIDANRLYLKGPKNLADIGAPRSNMDVEVLGVIPRVYKFNGMCDFQYLPMRRTKTRHVSIAHKILPGFGNPDIPNAKLDDLLAFRMGKMGRDKALKSFLVPSVLSRVDKPIDDLHGFLEGGVVKPTANSSATLTAHTVSTTRAKRVIYSHLCNFRVSDKKINSSQCLVPSGPMKQAIEDANKRNLLGAQLEIVKQLFEERPIYTKIQLEHECEQKDVGTFALKYLLPVVAYFALNGPWRCSWIRFGYDPRKDRFSYVYQLLDFRVPNPYRSLMQRKRNTTIEVDRESLFSYRQGTIPPKCQMIYQISEIKLQEVEELTKVLYNRMVENERHKFHTRYGFLSEDIIEYCRYCISRNIELYLFNQGRISAVTLPEVALPNTDGESVSDLVFKPGSSRGFQATTRRTVERKRFRARPRPTPGLATDEVSNQSSNLVDLKIAGHFVDDEDNMDETAISEEEDNDDDEDDEDVDDEFLQEALGATTLDEDMEDDEEEIDPEDIDPDQILGLE